MAFFKAIKNTIKIGLNGTAAAAGYAAGAINEFSEYVDQSQSTALQAINPNRKVKEVYTEFEEIGHEHGKKLTEKVDQGIDSIKDLFEDKEPKKTYTGYGSFGAKK